jgi:hypothetical protein
MSKEEFNNASYESVQNNFFLGILQHREYRFKSLGMKADSGTLVLFQYAGQIIAIAILEDIVFFEQPLNDIYTGAYQFDPKSIVVFDPITREETRSIWSNFKQFSQSKQILDPKLFDLLHTLLLSKKMKCAIS